MSDNGLEVSWCLGEECIGDDGRELGPPAPEFSKSLFTTVALTGGEVTVNLVRLDDECEEEEVVLGPQGRAREGCGRQIPRPPLTCW